MRFLERQINTTIARRANKPAAQHQGQGVMVKAVAVRGVEVAVRVKVGADVLGVGRVGVTVGNKVLVGVGKFVRVTVEVGVASINVGVGVRVRRGAGVREGGIVESVSAGGGTSVGGIAEGVRVGGAGV